MRCFVLIGPPVLVVVEVMVDVVVELVLVVELLLVLEPIDCSHCDPVNIGGQRQTREFPSL